MMEHDQAVISQPGVIYLDIPRPSQTLIDSFAEVGVADVHESLGVNTLMDAAVRSFWPGARMVGPALTVLNVSGDTLMLHRALALSQAGDVLVVVADSPSTSAMWGALATTAARARGAAGAVVDGNVRDVADIRRGQFPVWARSASPRGSTRKGPGSINVPVLCGGVRVSPGDLIVADDDGVVVVPAEQIEQTLARAKARVAREADILPQLVAGRTPYELWRLEQALKASGVLELPGCYPG
jgi:4-hydroxy-4-methyl-2-oxoglutarate aldolase